MENNGKSQEWVEGYCDGLATAKRILSTLSRSDIADMVIVLDVMITSLECKPKKKD